MSVRLQHEEGNIYRLDISGRLRSDQFARCQQALATEIRPGCTVRLLVVLEAFEGWEPGEAWNDLSFFVTYGDSIDRIAIVGDNAWRSHVLIFAAVDLRRASVEFFEEGNEAVARAWLSAVTPQVSEQDS